MASTDSGKEEQTNQNIFLQIKSDFKKYVNFGLNISDPILKLEEQKYNQNYFVYFSGVTAMIIRSITYHTFLSIFCYYSITRAETKSNKWILFVLSAIQLLLMSPLSIYAIFNRNDFATAIKKNVIVASSFMVGYMLFSRVYAGPCKSDNFSEIWACNPQALVHALPQDSSLIVMLLPIVQTSCWGEIRIESIFFSWAVTIAWLIASIGYGNAYNSITTLAVYAPLSFVIIFENRRQFLINYFYMRRLELSRLRSEKQTVNFRDEFRSLIANMTHDLKTVSN